MPRAAALTHFSERAVYISVTLREEVCKRDVVVYIPAASQSPCTPILQEPEAHTAALIQHLHEFLDESRLRVYRTRKDVRKGVVVVCIPAVRQALYGPIACEPVSGIAKHSDDTTDHGRRVDKLPIADCRMITAVVMAQGQTLVVCVRHVSRVWETRQSCV